MGKNEQFQLQDERLSTVFSLWTGAVAQSNFGILGEDRASGIAAVNQSARSAVKVVITEARRLNWLRKVSGAPELVFCPDFFEAIPKSGRLRDELWQTIEETQQLEWILVASHPEQFFGKLPAYWDLRPFLNVCLAIILGDAPNTDAGHIESLRKTPSGKRGVWVKPEYDLAVMRPDLSGIDFTIQSSSTFTCPVGEHDGRERIGCESDARMLDGLRIVRLTSADAGAATLVDDHQNDLKPRVPRLVNRKTPRTDRSGRRSARPTVKPAQAALVTSSPMAAHDRLSSDAEASAFATTEVMLPSPEAQQSTPVEVVTGTKLDRFQYLDGAVRNGIRAVVEAGLALKEIRDGELWREADYPNWNCYCKSLLEWTRAYVNRLICHATRVSELSEDDPPLAADGTPILPASESLSRPLHKIEKRLQRANVWRLAVKRAGGMPTARIVADVVADLQPKDVSNSPLSRSAQRQSLIEKLREVANARSSWDAVAELLDKIQALK